MAQSRTNRKCKWYWCKWLRGQESQQGSVGHAGNPWAFSEWHRGDIIKTCVPQSQAGWELQYQWTRQCYLSWYSHVGEILTVWKHRQGALLQKLFNLASGSILASFTLSVFSVSVWIWPPDFSKSLLSTPLWASGFYCLSNWNLTGPIPDSGYALDSFGPRAFSGPLPYSISITELTAESALYLSFVSPHNACL